MRLKTSTIAYLAIGIIFSIIPTIIFALLDGRTIPGYVIQHSDVLLIFTFTFIPFIIGFLGGEMFVDDMDASDPLYNPTAMRKNKKD